MRIRTRWGFKLMAYPLIVIPLIVYFAAQGGESYRPDDRWPSAHNDSRADVATGAAHPDNAAQLIAFPDKTCWLDLKGMEYFCFRLTAERR